MRTDSVTTPGMKKGGLAAGPPPAKTKPSLFRTNLLIGIACVGLLPGLPLLGVFLAGKPLRDYAEFPPLTRYVEHAPFSWPAFTAMAVLILAAVIPFIVKPLRHQRRAPRRAGHPLPWWGWLGFALSGTVWLLAWNRFTWFAPLQVFAFSPLWLGYILVVNAWCHARTGRCMLTHDTGRFLRLFPVSAVFWWFFEYLNRFVQNWYYVGGDDLSPFQYFIFATLPFATVLPAVMGTYDLLASFPRVGAGLDNFVRLKVPCPRGVAGILLLVSSLALFGIGIAPDYLYPVLWLSPLVIITSLQRITGRTTIFRPVAHGRWRRLYLLALSALICGFFWEMWNYGSYAKWIYEVPFVGRFRIFEMPILGFAGYLPFGLECAVLADLTLGRRNHEGQGEHGPA